MSENNENLAPRYAFLGKWLSILFWLIIPGTIAGLMGSNTLMNSAPGVYIAGQILNAVCTLASGLIFLKLSAEEDRYKTAGICALIAAAASFSLRSSPVPQVPPTGHFSLRFPLPFSP